jgi:hypothetical protein
VHLSDVMNRSTRARSKVGFLEESKTCKEYNRQEQLGVLEMEAGYLKVYGLSTST